MKDLPPPAPPKIGGGLLTRPLHLTETGGEPESPLLDKEGVGGGCFARSRIHNKTTLKDRRKSLRNEATPAEKKLWSVLQNSQLNGYKFRHQHSVGHYILDFYCSAERLAIELDGDSHFTDDAIAYDHERTAYLNAINIKVIRFLNSDVYDQLSAVCNSIQAEIEKPSASRTQN